MHAQAREPNELEQMFVERANAGDVDGLVALYEPAAVIASGDRVLAIGREQIRAWMAQFLADRPRLGTSRQSPAVCCGDLALTSSRASNGDRTAEIARRQPEGHWLRVVDQFAMGDSGDHS